jgi:hypothetical protein
MKCLIKTSKSLQNLSLTCQHYIYTYQHVSWYCYTRRLEQRHAFQRDQAPHRRPHREGFRCCLRANPGGNRHNLTSLIKEDLAVGGQAIRAEIAEEIVDKVEG